LYPWDPFAAVQLGQPAVDLGADGFLVFLKPCLAFALDFQGVEEYVLKALESAAVQALLNQGPRFRGV
jgi:hypothetical protein